MLGGVFRPTRRGASFALSCLDAVGALFLLAVGLWLHGKERTAGKLYKKYVCTPSDYTVALRRSSLPGTYETLDELAQLLRSHFEHVLSRAPPVYRDGDVAVADVNFGINNRRVIRLMKRRGGIARRLDALDARRRLRGRDGQSGCCGNAARREDLKHALLRSKFDGVQKDLEELADDHATKSVRAVTAYVTFASEEGCLRCLQMYPPMLNSIAWLIQPAELRLKEARTVVLDRAAEPRDLYWENLGLRRGGQAVRRLAVVLVFVALLLASSGVVYWAETASARFEAKFPAADCYAYRGDGAVLHDPELDATYAFTSSVARLSMADVAKDELPGDFGAETGETGLLECFCNRVLEDEGLGAMLDYEFRHPDASATPRVAYDRWGGTWCETWAKRKATLYSYQSAAVVFVVGVEMLMEYIADFLTEAERHASRTKQMRSLTTKLAVASIINTGLLAVLINGNLNKFDAFKPRATSRVREFGVMRGGYDDFSADWYDAVAKAIFLSLALSFLSDVACYAAAYAAGRFARFYDRGFSNDVSRTRQMTQAGLNQVYTGRAMKFEVRYAVQIKFLVLCTLFSAGVPLLNALCLAVFACQYAIDKFLFSKFYAIPQTLTNELARLFSSFVPTAVFLRTCVAIWMWTNPDIVANDVAGVGAMATTAPGANATAAAGYAFFDDGGGGGPLALERLGHRNAAPHVVVLAVLLCMVARRVLRVALNDVGFARDAVAGVLARCGCCDAAAFFRDLIEQQGYNFPDYFQALSTACLERNLAQKLLKRGVLRCVEIKSSTRLPCVCH